MRHSRCLSPFETLFRRRSCRDTTAYALCTWTLSRNLDYIGRSDDCSFLWETWFFLFTNGICYKMWQQVEAGHLHQVGRASRHCARSTTVRSAGCGNKGLPATPLGTICPPKSRYQRLDPETKTLQSRKARGLLYLPPIATARSSVFLSF